MKNLLLSALFLVGFSAFAQPDVAVKLVSPPDGGSFTAGVQFNCDIRIINKGTVDIDAMDTVLYAPQINGQLINAGGAPLIWFSTGTAINAGDSTTFSNTLNLSGGSSGNLNFCAITAVIGAGWNGVPESDTVNNVDCNSVTYDAGSVSTAEFKVVDFVDNSFFANGIYHVDMQDAVVNERPVLRVYNITGQEVYMTDLNANGDNINQEVSLNGLNKGVYIVQVLSGSRALSTRKIMVN
jgi:hypothetical protein